MSSPDDDRLTDQVADSISQCLGVNVPPSQCRPWAVNLLSLIGGNPVWGKEDWRHAMEYFGLGNLFTIANPPTSVDQPYDPPKPDRLVGELMNMFGYLAAELGTEMPVPPNNYLVGMRGEDLYVGNVCQGRITTGQALNLAVWLVALADPQLKQFAPMLAKVLQT